MTGVSVVIPLFNEYPFIILLLDSIVIFTSKEIPYEIVVVDSSTDTTKAQEILDLFDIPTTLVISDKNHYGIKQNMGVRAARYDKVFFLNSDICVSPNWLSWAVEDYDVFSKQFKLGWLGAASCQVSGWQDFSQVPVNHCFHHVPRIIDGISMISQNAFWDAGGFDEDAPCLQFLDDDLSVRLLQKEYVNAIGRTRLHHFSHGCLNTNEIDWRKDLEIGAEWFLNKHGRLPQAIYDEYLANLAA